PLVVVKYFRHFFLIFFCKFPKTTINKQLKRLKTNFFKQNYRVKGHALQPGSPGARKRASKGTRQQKGTSFFKAFRGDVVGPAPRAAPSGDGPLLTVTADRHRQSPVVGRPVTAREIFPLKG